MNLTALDAAVRSKGYSFLQAAGDPTSPITIELNEVYRQVNGAQRWPWLEKSVTLVSTTAGTDTYTLSTLSDFRQLDAVRLTDSSGVNYDLQNMEPQDFKTQTFESNSLPLQTGQPVAWTQYAGAVKLWPAPDGVYQIIVDYIFTPVDMATGTDIPILPPVYHDVLVWGAVFALSYRERDWISRSDASNQFQTRYKQMQQEYELMQRQTSSRVKKSGVNNSYGYDFGWSAGL